MKKKQCRDCREVKALSEFYKNGKGFNSYCKKCDNARTIRRRKEPGVRDEVRKKYREWYRKKGKEYYKKPEVIKRISEWGKKYRQSPGYKLKNKARMALYEAIKSGEMQRKECVVCNSNKTEGHHPDHLEPLVVIWMCSECHAEHHVQERRKKSIHKGGD